VHKAEKLQEDDKIGASLPLLLSTLQNQNLIQRTFDKFTNVSPTVCLTYPLTMSRWNSISI
jgi:hypothetical protein